jgi:TolA-binding protein
MPIPWDKVILHGPQALDVARNLYGKWQARPKPADVETQDAPRDPLYAQLNTLNLRLKALEDAGEKQAALATQLAEQDQALSTGVTTLKAHAEHLQKEIEDIRTTQEKIASDFKELSAQFQQVKGAATAFSKKITLSIVIALGALALSIFALFGLVPR